MKTAAFLHVPILGLILLFTPTAARAEDPAPVNPPIDAAALLSGWRKAASSAPSADGQGQAQELQASLTALLKALSQLSPDSTASALPAVGSASSRFDLSDLPDEGRSAPSPAPGGNLSIQSSGPLRTGGLVSGSLGSRLDDAQWRQLFQRRSKGR